MKKSTLGAGIASAFTNAAPARAGDFSGPRVELYAGWDRLETKGSGRASHRTDGVTYGAGFGYDLAVGPTLRIGVEGDLDLSNAIGKVSGTTRVESDSRRDLAVGARVGAKFGDHLLVYAKAAYANARIKDGTIVGTSAGGKASNRDGVRFGAGAEYSVASHLYLKAEYRYSNYSDGVSRNQLLAGLGVRF